MSGLYAKVRGGIRLVLHPGQTRAWESEKRFVFVIAGTQSGKTSWGPWWLWREVLMRGAGDYLAVTATYDLFKLKMLPEMLTVFCDLMAWGDYMAGDKVIVSRDGKSRIILRSANALRGLESSTAKAAWLDECGQDDFTLEAWEAIQRRLSLSQGRVLGTTTPYNLGWLKSEVFDRWKGGHPDYDVVQFRSTMNPAFPREEYERAKAVLPSWKHAMFYDGEFTKPAGLIYCDYLDSYVLPSEGLTLNFQRSTLNSQWVDSTSAEPSYVGRGCSADLTSPGPSFVRRGIGGGGNLVRAFSVPGTWLRSVGIDFGAVNTALVWVAEEPGTGNYFVYREKLGGGLTGPQHAREALEYREPVKSWLGGSASEDAQRLDWQLVGCPVVEPPISDVEAGIDRVIGLFRERRLFVFDTCVGLRSELGTYSRELDDAGQPTEKIQDKQKFHRLDALRYVCSSFPLERPSLPKPDEVVDDSRKLGSVASRLGRYVPRETEEYV